MYIYVDQNSPFEYCECVVNVTCTKRLYNNGIQTENYRHTTTVNDRLSPMGAYLQFHFLGEGLFEAGGLIEAGGLTETGGLIIFAKKR